MADINLFELAGKSTRRLWEALTDTCSIAENTIAGGFPVDRLLPDKDYFAGSNCYSINRTAVDCLDRGDVSEARHQLRREIYFSSLFATQSRCPDAIAARAALAELDQSQDCHRARSEMREVWSAATELGPVSIFDDSSALHQSAHKEFERAWDSLFDLEQQAKK